MDLRLRPATSAPPDLWRMLGRSGKAFALGLLAYGILFALSAPDWACSLCLLVTLGAGLVIAWKLFRFGLRRVIWRLRYRLALAYVFMALIPVLLLGLMGGLVAWLLSAQVLAYLVTTNLDHRVDELRSATEAVMQAPPGARREGINRMGEYYAGAYPGFTMHYRKRDGAETRFPAASPVAAPPDAWGPASGVVARDGGFYLWARAVRDDASLTTSVPLSNDILNALATGLGVVELSTDIQIEATSNGRGIRVKRPGRGSPARQPRTGAIPAGRFYGDLAVFSVGEIPYANWTEAGSRQTVGLAAYSRMSAVFAALFHRDLAATNELVGTLLRIFAVLFCVVELIALVIGISLTRSITSAMHDLYDGTTRVMEGDFAHRIRPRGHDQIASLSYSFNRMTENMEQLLKVAAEKERMQADIEIAREVQVQMYPRRVPDSPRLRLAAACLPARSVSGDFFDYQRLADGRIALLLGDVAGKGISAALLMATIQTSCRARLAHALDGPSQVVSELNHQVCQASSPEKYATLCFCVFDEATGELRYTNAAHLPPLLVRAGQDEVTQFNVDGTIVGSFPKVTFGESRTTLRTGDLIVFYTDGVTEPENEYGEQFGEERLIEIVRRYADRGENEIIQAVSHAVRQWTGSPELQDDLTMMLARVTS